MESEQSSHIETSRLLSVELQTQFSPLTRIYAPIATRTEPKRHRPPAPGGAAVDRENSARLGAGLF